MSRYQMRDVACGLVKIVDTQRNRCLQKPHGDEFFTRPEAREIIASKNAAHLVRLQEKERCARLASCH